MPACPVCENQEAGADACDVCGHAFTTTSKGPISVASVEGLEPTLHEPVPEPREQMVDLEPTLHEQVPEAREQMVDLEPTAMDPVPDDAGPGGPAVCRYCRTPATAEELLCLRCGMRLPGPRSTPPPLGTAARRPCSDCGGPTTGGRCPACGARQAGG
jgi:hypothetical protein